MDNTLSFKEVINAYSEREKEGKEIQKDESFYALGLAGEVGEYCNFLKKRLRGDLLNTDLKPEEQKDLDEGEYIEDIIAKRVSKHKEKEARELADVILYVAKICQKCDIDLEQYIKEKFNKYSNQIESKIQL